MSLAGTNIRKIRTLKGWSQSKLAEKLGINRASIGSYEEGRAEPKLETLIKMADLFSLSVDQLVGSELSMNKLIGFNINPGSENKNVSELIHIPLYSKRHSPIVQDGEILGGKKHIALPIAPTICAAGFALDNYSMHVNGKGPLPGDIIICELVEDIPLGIPVVIGDKLSWNFGKIREFSKRTITLEFSNRNYQDLPIERSADLTLWKLRGVYSEALLF